MEPPTSDESVNPALPDEGRLIRLFREERDGAAFEELYRLHRRMVYGTCLRYLKRPEAAEDACHDVFVQAHLRFDTLRGDALRPWLRRIAVNHCLNRQRRASTRRRIEPILVHRAEGTRSDTALGSAAARQELRIAAKLVRDLSPKQRLVFLLRHVEQLAYDGIVEATGLSLDEVRSALQNARRNFRIGWQQQMEIMTTRGGAMGRETGRRADEEADCG